MNKILIVLKCCDHEWLWDAYSTSQTFVDTLRNHVRISLKPWPVLNSLGGNHNNRFLLIHLSRQSQQQKSSPQLGKFVTLMSGLVIPGKLAVQCCSISLSVGKWNVKSDQQWDRPYKASIGLFFSCQLILLPGLLLYSIQSDVNWPTLGSQNSAPSISSSEAIFAAWLTRQVWIATKSSCVLRASLIHTLECCVSRTNIILAPDSPLNSFHHSMIVSNFKDSFPEGIKLVQLN